MVNVPASGVPIAIVTSGKLVMTADWYRFFVDVNRFVNVGFGSLDETIADAVGAMVTGNTETGIDVTYEDSDNTLDFVVSAEFIADTVGAMVTGNTETGIAVTYDDADNTLDFVVDTEFIADTVGAMLSGNTETNITVTYQDADNTIDFVVPAASESTAGVMEVATAAEVATGTDDTRAVTPAKLGEGVADIVGAMVTGNTETNITVTYQDADNTLDFVVPAANETTAGVLEVATAAEVAALTDDTRAVTPAKLGEGVADIVGAMFSGNTETHCTVTYQDADNTIDVVVNTGSETVIGAVELATNAETVTGTSTTLATHPAGVAAALAAIGSAVSVTVFDTTGGTWTRTTENRALVIMQAAGGGGGGVGNTAGTGTGGQGGAGETRIGVFTVTGNETVTLGAVGTGGTAGNNAGTTASDSTFGSHMTCKGGTGGGGSTGATAGTNGTTPSGSGGSAIPPMGLAANSSTTLVNAAPSSIFGMSRQRVTGTNYGGSTGGGRGTGGDAANDTGTTSRAGADGAPAYCIVIGLK